jgi:hypothetical protein
MGRREDGRRDEEGGGGRKRRKERWGDKKEVGEGKMPEDSEDGGPRDSYFILLNLVSFMRKWCR